MSEVESIKAIANFIINVPGYRLKGPFNTMITYRELDILLRNVSIGYNGTYDPYNWLRWYIESRAKAFELFGISSDTAFIVYNGKAIGYNG